MEPTAVRLSAPYIIIIEDYKGKSAYLKARFPFLVEPIRKKKANAASRVKLHPLSLLNVYSKL